MFAFPAPPSLCTGRIPSQQDFSLVVRLESCKSVREVQQIHAVLVKLETRPFPSQLICARILSLPPDSVSSNDKFIYACSLFKQCERPDVYILNAIFQGLSTCENYSMLTIDLYREMLLKGLIPDAYTVPHALKACTESQSLSGGHQIHAHSIKSGLVSNVFVKNTLMRLYAVCGIIDAVHKVFEEGRHRDVVSWTTLIQGYLKMGNPWEAVAAFFRMCQTNLRADEMTLVIVLSACSKLGDLSLGRKIHRYIRLHNINIDSDVFLGNALVDMYLKCGESKLARQVFDAMPVKNVVSWNSMISGLSQQGQFKEALEAFRKMQNTGLKPDDITLVGVLNSCANLGVLELGKWVHAYIDKNHIIVDGFIGNALVDMYAKCGSIPQALGVFQAMKCKDVYSYTAMIVGLAMNGEAQRALNIFSEMPNLGIRPDEVTFVGVLTACSHAGLVEEGWEHFADMSRVYNLEPQLEHYGCVVDLLGRAGLICQAEEFIKNMPILPDASVWGALLGACKKYSKVDLGASVIKELVKMEPGRDGSYILMSNIYSSANRWREALKWRQAMKERNMKKTPGCSSIEVDGVVHAFRKADKSHPKRKELYQVLEGITVHLTNHETSP